MNARLQVRLLRAVPKAKLPPRKPGTWGPLSEPVDPIDTLTRSRAQSLLCGMRYRDGGTNPGTLSIDQARDVLAWSQPQK